MAKHYGVQVAVCPPRRPQRKGVVEKAIDYLTQSWWRSAPVSSPAQAQADLDRWCVAVSDRRRRGKSIVSELAAAEPLLALPELPFPASTARSGSSRATRWSSSSQTATALRPDTPATRSRSARGSGSCTWRSTRPLVTGSRGIAARCPARGRRSAPPEHASMLERAVLEQFTTRRPCSRKPNRPPGERALAEAAKLRGEQDSGGVVVDLEQYARIARVAGR